MQLQQIFGDRLKENEPLKNHSNYRIGGPADWYLEVKTSDEAVQAIQAAHADTLPIFVLGGGSNILISDDGIRGLVLVVADRGVKTEGERIIAAAGAITASVAKISATAGLAGMEWAIGVPGTVGGAVRGNAGCYGGETKDHLESVEVVDLASGGRMKLQNIDCRFGYRESRFKHERFLILSATFKLALGDSAASLQRIKDLIALRKEKQPLEYSSAGCIFKNVQFSDSASLPGELLLILTPEQISQKRISAGFIIDRANLKGARVGDAQIAPKHGNFFVNTGSASAREVLELIAHAKTSVKDRFGIQLQEEIQLVGF